MRATPWGPDGMHKGSEAPGAMISTTLGDGGSDDNDAMMLVHGAGKKWKEGVRRSWRVYVVYYDQHRIEYPLRSRK